MKKFKHGKKQQNQQKNFLVRFVKNHKYITLFIIAVILIIPYIHTINYPFQYDDYPTIFEDSKNKGFENILKIRFSDRPIRKISLIIDRTLFGQNVVPYRMENLILYIFSIFLSGIFILLLTDSYLFAIISMMIFAVHPLHVSSLMIVTHRKELFLSIFALLAFIFHIKERKKKSIIFFILAILSKETAIILPILFIIYDIIFKKRLNKKYYSVYAGFILLGVIIVLFFYSQTGFYLPGISNMESFLHENRIFRNVQYRNLILIQPYIFIMYFIKLFLPINLNVDYYVPLYFSVSLLKMLAFFGFLIFFYLLYYFRKNKFILFGLLFFIINYLPVSNIIPVLNLLSDRYMFFPLLTINILLYVIFIRFYRFKYYVFVPIILLYLILSIQYMSVFKSEISLWKYVVNKNPKSVVGNNNLGLYYMENGDANNALIFLNKAYELDSLYVNSIINLGSLYAKMDRKDKAVNLFEKAIKIEDYNIKAYYNLALVLLKMGEIEKSRQILEQLLNLSPNSTVPMNMLATIYYRNGLDSERIFTLLNTIFVNPFASIYATEIVGYYNYADSIYNIGIAIEPSYERIKKNIEIINNKIIRDVP